MYHIRIWAGLKSHAEFKLILPTRFMFSCFFKLKASNSFVELIFFSFIFISWRLITLQYCSGFCHTLTWIIHEFTCVALIFLKQLQNILFDTGSRERGGKRERKKSNQNHIKVLLRKNCQIVTIGRWFRYILTKCKYCVKNHISFDLLTIKATLRLMW